MGLLGIRHTWRALLIRRGVPALIGICLCLPGLAPATVAGATGEKGLKGSGNVEGALLVQVRRGVTESDATDVVSRVRGQELARFDESRVRVVSVAPAEREAARRQLLADARVESVEDDAVASAALTPNDYYWQQQWNMRRVRAPEAWSISRGDSSAVIAIVDTGVDPSHPDLRGRVMRGWDFQNDDPNPYDDDGHGTAVATTAAAAGNDSTGIAGACWRCRILPVKVLNGNGHGTHSNIAAGIRWAANHGADVINLSIAGLGSTVVLADAISYAERHGVVVVAAAGNAGSSRKTYPAAYPGVISVAATNNVDRLYEWSNRGSWVTLAAPGCSFSGRPHARWAWLCGTSLSTPVVAGTVGLMKSVAPNVGAYRLGRMITSTAQRVRIPVAHGRLDTTRALRLAWQAAADSDDGSTEPGTDPGTASEPDPTPSSTSYEWSGNLAAGDSWDREVFHVRGKVHVNVRWAGRSQLVMWVQNPQGAVIEQRTGSAIDFRMDLTAGDYTFTVQQTGGDEVSYQVMIDSGG